LSIVKYDINKTELSILFTKKTIRNEEPKYTRFYSSLYTSCRHSQAAHILHPRNQYIQTTT